MPMLWLMLPLLGLFTLLLLVSGGWHPQIQQTGDYITGKTLAILAGAIGMWFILKVLDWIFPGDWFEEISNDPVSVRWVTCAVVVAVGVIVAWS